MGTAPKIVTDTDEGFAGFTNTTALSNMTVAGVSVDDVMPFIKPTLVQILLSLIQVALLMFASQGPRIVKIVNGMIGNLQKKMNDKVNGDIKSVVDKVFGEAFNTVKGEADKFFPKIKKVLDALSKVPGM